ncbi:hypothetical protein ABZ454_20360 [Streptomyces sp. NPDC005803]|uniref:hypothetical protein n=1 Tax=Streptomyces sp. NPDC005803 TaxID=3154297 RepID=UPI00340479EA
MRISASIRSRSVRAGTVVAATVAVAGATLAGASTAFAAPGDSGDIEIHSVGWNSRGNDGVEVCKFVLSASNFGELLAVPWTITAQSPNAAGDTLQSTLPLVNGSARSQEYLLPEGTYQLVWVVTSPKQKSFVVDCDKPGDKGGRADGADRGSSAAGAEAGTGAGRGAESGSETGYEKGSEQNSEKSQQGSQQNSEKGSEKASPQGSEQGSEKASQQGSEKGYEAGYERPSGGVPAGGGGVPDMESTGSESDSNLGTTAALAAGAAGAAGLIMVRRAARRRARHEA